MNSKFRALAAGAAVFFACAMVAGDAAAQMRKHSMGRSGMSSRSSVRMPSSSMRSMSNRGMRTAPRVSSPRLSPGPSRGRVNSINRGLPSGNRGSSSRGGNYGLGNRGGGGLPDLLNGLGQYGLLDQFSDRRDPYLDAQREQADAYRDVAIINGVAGILGVVINNAMQAPPAQYQQPAGRYEIQRMVVKEGYWHEYQVQVPDQYDPNTGQRILGHYETRQKWVPPVYEERQIWVPYGR